MRKIEYFLKQLYENLREGDEEVLTFKYAGMSITAPVCFVKNCNQYISFFTKDGCAFLLFWNNKDDVTRGGNLTYTMGLWGRVDGDPEKIVFVLPDHIHLGLSFDITYKIFQAIHFLKKDSA